MKGIKETESTKDLAVVLPRTEELRTLRHKQIVHPTERKTCSRCHKSLPISDFGKNASSPDGLMQICKQCRKEQQAIRNYQLTMARKQQERPEKIIASKQCAKCHNRFTVDHFYKNKLSEDGYGSVCKTCQKGYERAWRERNKMRAQQSTPNSELISKRCSWCHKDRPISAFCRNSTKADGYGDQCSDCRKEKAYARSLKNVEKLNARIASGSLPATKLCRKCEKELPLDSFYKDSLNYVDGRCNTCIDCHRTYERELRNRLKTQHEEFGVDPKLTVKHCWACNRDLPVDCFSKNSCKPDGLSYECKECTSKIRRGIHRLTY